MDGRSTLLGRLAHSAAVTLGGAVLTALFFLLLPLIQAITQPAGADTLVRAADTAEPDKPPEMEDTEEPEEEPEQEQEPPKLADEPQPQDLSSIENALNATFGGDGWAGAGTLGFQLPGAAQGPAQFEEMFSADDLDQKPRVIYQPSPVLDAKLRKHTPGKVLIIFDVDPSGRVVDPKVQTSTDPALERPALAAVKQWKFESGKRKGKAVRFRMRVPITFPEL